MMKRLVPRDFTVPTLVETDHFRIRPLTIHDVVKDYDAVMTSQEHLRATLPWSWPPPDLTLEQDLIDLGWHQKEFQMETSFDFAVMSLDESRLLGCVYVDPTDKTPKSPSGSAPTSSTPGWSRSWKPPSAAGSPATGPSPPSATPAATCPGTSGTHCQIRRHKAGLELPSVKASAAQRILLVLPRDELADQLIPER